MQRSERCDLVQDQLLCACMKARYSSRVTFAEIDSSSASCRLCCLYRDIVLAVIGGCLPALFEAGSRSKAENELILEQLEMNTTERKLAFNILEQHVNVAFFRDGRIEANRDFTIQGQHFPVGFRVGRHTNSRESFGRAQKWLLECLTNHDCPRLSPAGVLLPKRLLDVRGSAHCPIRLIETRGNEHPYVCLSHRWGSAMHKQLKTTIRTIQDHMVKINWDNLPATFQDAVTVCRSMGINYIWIDSLCILQEFNNISPSELKATRQDFAQENSLMSRTYQNSHFTISADLSTHMDSGIFSQRAIDDHRIELTADDGNNASLYIRQNVDHYGDEIPDLETRGWTLQEFLLPPRVLHFGHFDIEWRCKTRLTCECLHLDRERPPRQSTWHRHHSIHEVAKPPPADPEGALRWWETVVHSYTSRELANPSDKLPALSGLAQLRKQVRGGVYLAGLWQDSLAHDLCWYHTFNYNFATSGGVGRRPAGYRAPSWSWASVDTDSGCSFWWTGAIGIHPIMASSEPRQVCAIFESSCQPKTADPMGEVQNGLLDISVALIPAEICRDPKQKVVWTIRNIETTLALEFFKPDCELEDDDLEVGGRVYCAPIAEAGWDQGCLVLKNLDVNLYQRVGFCILTKDDQNFPVLKPPDYAFQDTIKARITVI